MAKSKSEAAVVASTTASKEGCARKGAKLGLWAGKTNLAEFLLLVLSCLALVYWRLPAGLDFTDSGYFLCQYRDFGLGATAPSYYLASFLGQLLLRLASGKIIYLRLFNLLCTALAYHFALKAHCGQTRLSHYWGLIPSFALASYFSFDLLYLHGTALLVALLLYTLNTALRSERAQVGLYFSAAALLYGVGIAFRINNFSFGLLFLLALWQLPQAKRKQACLALVATFVAASLGAVLCLGLSKQLPLIQELLLRLFQTALSYNNHSLLLLALRLGRDLTFACLFVLLFQLLEKLCSSKRRGSAGRQKLLLLVTILLLVPTIYLLLRRWGVARFNYPFIIALAAALFWRRSAPFSTTAQRQYYDLALLAAACLSLFTTNALSQAVLLCFLFLPPLAEALAQRQQTPFCYRPILTALLIASLALHSFWLPYRESRLSALTAHSQESSFLWGIRSSKPKMAALDTLLEVIKQQMAQGTIPAETKLLCLGDIPLLQYLCPLPPLSYKAWLDLRSFSSSDFAEQLLGNEAPLLVIEALFAAHTGELAAKPPLLLQAPAEENEEVGETGGTGETGEAGEAVKAGQAGQEPVATAQNLLRQLLSSLNSQQNDLPEKIAILDAYLRAGNSELIYQDKYFRLHWQP